MTAKCILAKYFVYSVIAFKPCYSYSQSSINFKEVWLWIFSANFNLKYNFNKHVHNKRILQILGKTSDGEKSFDRTPKGRRFIIKSS